MQEGARRIMPGSKSDAACQCSQIRRAPPRDRVRSGMREFESSHSSQAVLFLENFLSSMRKARQMRAFLIANSLWRPTFELFGPRIPKNLQPNPRKLPFSGDSPLETEE